MSFISFFAFTVVNRFILERRERILYLAKSTMQQQHIQLLSLLDKLQQAIIVFSQDSLELQYQNNVSIEFFGNKTDLEVGDSELLK